VSRGPYNERGVPQEARRFRNRNGASGPAYATRPGRTDISFSTDPNPRPPLSPSEVYTCARNACGVIARYYFHSKIPSRSSSRRRLHGARRCQRTHAPYGVIRRTYFRRGTRCRLAHAGSEIFRVIAWNTVSRLGSVRGDAPRRAFYVSQHKYAFCGGRQIGRRRPADPFYSSLLYGSKVVMIVFSVSISIRGLNVYKATR